MALKTTNKKFRSQKNVIKTVTFGRKKIKVGKILKKTNATNTRIKTQKVIMLEQLKTNASTTQAISYRGLSIDDLCRRMTHYNECVVRNAIIGNSF